MNRPCAALLSVALALPVALGALGAHASTEPAATRAGVYAIDPSHTMVQFAVDHFGFNDYFGILPDATGSLSLDPKQVGASKLDVTLPVSRLSTTNGSLDAQLKGADWFDAAKYPTIHFVSQQVVATGARTAQISGLLTMHGVTRPLVLDATFGGAGVNPLSKAYTAGFKASGRLKRSDFGVSKYVPLVGDDVILTITAAFEQK